MARRSPPGARRPLRPTRVAAGRPARLGELAPRCVMARDGSRARGPCLLLRARSGRRGRRRRSRASRAAIRRSETACCVRFRVNAVQPAQSEGQVAIASPAIRKPRSGHENARWPGEWPGRVEHLQRAEGVAVVERLVHRAGDVPRPVQPEPELERDQLQRLLRQHGDRLRAAVAADDVGLPGMRVDRRAARPLQRREAAEVRAVAVRDRDPLQVGDAPAEPVESPRARAGRRSRTACRRATARRRPRGGTRSTRPPAPWPSRWMPGASSITRRAARCQGANGFATPASAGSSSGKWRRSSVRIELASTQSSPSCV